MYGHIGKVLIIIGLVIAATGLLLTISGHLPKGFPFVGKLPGDVVIRKGNFTFYFPLATSIIISALLTLIFMFLNRK